MTINLYINLVRISGGGGGAVQFALKKSGLDRPESGCPIQTAAPLRMTHLNLRTCLKTLRKSTALPH